MDRENSGGSGGQKVLETAKRLFAEKGYDGVSVSAIAATAGTSKANVYHHFESKEALYLAVLAAAHESYQQLPELLSGNEELTVRIGRLLKEHQRLLYDDEQSTRLLLQEIVLGNAERGERLAREVFMGVHQGLVDAIRQAQQAGQVRDDIDPGLAVLLMLAPSVLGFMARHILPHLPASGDSGDSERSSRLITDTLMHGLLTSTSKQAAGAVQ